MFVVTVQFKIKEGAMDGFLSLMHENARLSVEREQGCVTFDVCTDADRPNFVFLYEVYKDAAAFDVHLQSEHFRVFDSAVGDMIAGKAVQTYSTVFQG